LKESGTGFHLMHPAALLTSDEQAARENPLPPKQAPVQLDVQQWLPHSHHNRPFRVAAGFSFIFCNNTHAGFLTELREMEDFDGSETTSSTRWAAAPDYAAGPLPLEAGSHTVHGPTTSMDIDIGQ
jgi:hypothetical protein